MFAVKGWFCCHAVSSRLFLQESRYSCIHIWLIEIIASRLAQSPVEICPDWGCSQCSEDKPQLSFRKVSSQKQKLQTSDFTRGFLCHDSKATYMFIFSARTHALQTVLTGHISMSQCNCLCQPALLFGRLSCSVKLKSIDLSWLNVLQLTTWQLHLMNSSYMKNESYSMTHTKMYPLFLFQSHDMMRLFWQKIKKIVFRQSNRFTHNRVLDLSLVSFGEIPWCLLILLLLILELLSFEAFQFF